MGNIVSKDSSPAVNGSGGYNGSGNGSAHTRSHSASRPQSSPTRRGSSANWTGPGSGSGLGSNSGSGSGSGSGGPGGSGGSGSGSGFGGSGSGSGSGSGMGSGSGYGSNSGSGSSGQSRKRRDQDRERRHRERHEGYQLIVDPSEKVDGGYLFPQGVYSGPQDFKVSVVRDCVIRRKLAPFYKGLEEVDTNWTDEQLLRSIYGTASSSDSKEELKELNDSVTGELDKSEPKIENLGLDIPAPKPSLNGAGTSVDRPSNIITAKSAPKSGTNSNCPGLHSELHSGSNLQSSGSSGPSELPSVPKPPNGLSEEKPDKKTPRPYESKNKNSVTRTRSHTMGQLKEANAWLKEIEDTQQIWLYRNVHECPICFLVYPRLNNTRCCGQDICTECFVQIKRQPPHPPYDTPQNNAQGVVELVSEVVCCPYCAQPDFGVIFDAPPFEWGIPKPHHASVNGSGGRPRRTSIPSTHPDVVTVDMIRPDWEAKLASARRRLVRKSAAARALHETALLPPTSPSHPHSNHSSSPSHPGAQTRSARHDLAAGDLTELLRSANGLTVAQSRELERRMLDEAIRASLQTS